MFNFFRKRAGKHDPAETPEVSRTRPNDVTTNSCAVTARALRHDNENDKSNAKRKDVVNLLIPETDYNQKTGVSAILHNIMPGKRRKNKRSKITRAESFREITPEKETQLPILQRSVSDLESTYKHSPARDDVSAPTPAENITDAPQTDHADFVKALVLQKYANKSPIDTKKQHVSLVYVSDEPNIDEKRHAEILLREIARSIDCTIEKINEEKELMGTTDSKTEKPAKITRNEPVYESIDENDEDQDIKALKDDLKGELKKLLKEQNEKNEECLEKIHNEDKLTPALKKKSNLKPPKSDTEGCSDDDRSEGSKKKVTFRKHILFDDGDQQTDQETDSSFETLTSESETDSEETEEEQENLPDNDERLGGVVVSRNDTDNKTLIENINQKDPVTIKVECCDEVKVDNSDSGFTEISDNKTIDSSESEVTASESESEVESEPEIQGIVEEVEDSSEYEEIEVEDEGDSSDLAEEVIKAGDPRLAIDQKTLVTHDSKFQHQVATLTELADSRCEEAEQTRDLISQYRKEIEERDKEIERLKCELAAAYKESELVRQRSRSLEEELSAARSCSAGLATQLANGGEVEIRHLRSQLEDALNSRAELESRVQGLERDRDRLEQEKRIQEQKAQETLATAEANTTKWRLAHESARSQAAARAERMLADCEWKMRELEKRAREAEKKNGELIQSVEELKSAKTQPSASHMAELQQIRGLATEQQRSVLALTLQLQKVETREEALKLEVHRLKELLDKQVRIGNEKEERHQQAIERLEQSHARSIENLRQEQAAAAAAAASTRAALDRAHADKTRTALAQLRAEADKESRNADRKLREVTARFENLKEELASKEKQWERAISEANSKADWELMQLRHLLDRADITHANNMEKTHEKFEREKEFIIEEWTSKVRVLENKMATEQNDARKLLETTRNQLIAEKNDMINKLKEQHRREIDDQWEKLQADKESCLARMKEECRLEGEEERVQREKELLEEIAELKSLVQSKVTDYDTLEVKAAQCGRTLAVTEQELREALAREKELREKRSEDAAKIRQVERASKDQVDHLTRKCACLRKLFDDMRAKLTERERASGESAREKDAEIAMLKGEVARLTRLLAEQRSPKLGARTCADGCETVEDADETLRDLPNVPRRKGSTKRNDYNARKRTLPDLPSLPPESRLTVFDEQDGRPRAKSIDLPAVQVPVRIKQLQEKLDVKLINNGEK